MHIVVYRAIAKCRVRPLSFGYCREYVDCCNIGAEVIGGFIYFKECILSYFPLFNHEWDWTKSVTVLAKSAFQ